MYKKKYETWGGLVSHGMVQLMEQQRYRKPNTAFILYTGPFLTCFAVPGPAGHHGRLTSGVAVFICLNVHVNYHEWSFLN
jgi:hypothetical protein